MNYKQLAVSNYKHFCTLEGNEYIASEFALQTILRLIEKYKPVRILEIGLGIGAICDTVLKYAAAQQLPIHYVGTEANAFCLEALRKNVVHYDGLELHADVTTINNQTFDLIIVDGSDEHFSHIADLCHKDTIIYIEGDRGPQTRNVKEIFPNARHINVITLAKNRPYAHGSSTPATYMGGGQLLFTDPTLDRKLFWFREKVVSFTIRNIRDLIDIIKK